MKKIGIAFIVLLLVIAGVVYIFRQEIFQYSAETVIKKNLPPYVTVNRIIFDLRNKIMKVTDLRVRNPKGYQNKDLAQLDSITCAYKMQGENILDGIEVTSIEAKGGVINIERLADGRLNLNEMGQVMKKGRAPKKEAKAADTAKKGKSRFDISKLVKLTDTINLRDGKVVLLDKAVAPGPYLLTFENINADLVIKLNKSYTDVLSVASEGSGDVNGDFAQRARWVISLDPKTRDLTMSNRIEISGVDVTLFKPYYDKYSPIEIIRGRVSGSLVFDFDNGDIGSMNTVRLRDLKFREKQDSNAANFWDVTITDVIQYLQTSPGEITFDFKIKGTMQDPRFYPGPVVKKAIQSMAVDKISQLLTEPEKKEGQAVQKTDAEVVVDVLKGLFKK